MASALDKKAVHRDKRAQNIASMGLVRREGSRFCVTAPASRSRRTQFEVWRDESNRVRCSCLEFQELASAEAAFRCEHILAVKYALLNKSSETNSPSLENPSPVVASSPTQEPAAQTESGPNGFESGLAAGSPLASGSVSRGELDPVIQASPVPEVQTASYDDIPSDAAGAPVLALPLSHALRFSRQAPDSLQNNPAGDQAVGDPFQAFDSAIDSLTLSHLLNRAAPGWSHAIRSIVAFGESVAVTAALTIDGVTREGLGIGAISATGIQQAEGEALKSAALKFHIAQHVPGSHARITDKGTTKVANLYGDPLARSVADLVTPKQLGILRALGRELNVDVDTECQNVMRCKTDEISKRAASGLIEYLGALRNQTPIVVRRAS